MAQQEDAESSQRPLSASDSVDSDAHSTAWADAPDVEEQSAAVAESDVTDSTQPRSSGEGKSPSTPSSSIDTVSAHELIPRSDDSHSRQAHEGVEPSESSAEEVTSTPSTPVASVLNQGAPTSFEPQSNTSTPNSVPSKASTGVAALMRRFESSSSTQPKSRSNTQSPSATSTTLAWQRRPSVPSAAAGSGSGSEKRGEDGSSSAMASETTADENASTPTSAAIKPSSITPAFEFAPKSTAGSVFSESEMEESPWASEGTAASLRPDEITGSAAAQRADRNTVIGSSNRFSTISLSSTVPSLARSEATDAQKAANLSDESAHPVTPDRIGSECAGGPSGTYDFLLARLENENGRLSRDPKAARASVDGVDKLKDNFERLKEKVGHKRGLSSGSDRKALSPPVSPGQPLIIEEKEDDDDDDDKEPEEAGEPSTDRSGEEAEEDQIDWDFWGNVMNNYQHVARNQPQDLSRAIQAGIPATLRGMMWQLMSSSKDEEMEMIYSFYLKQSTSHEKAIRRDLSRTFPEQDYFQDGKGVGQDNLFNVVKAYSLYDEEVGYCQGINFLVGPLLMNMPDEEAFSTLVRLMKSYDLRGHFTPNMPLLQLRLFQFDRLLEEFLPLLHKHLVRQGVKSSMYASQWFMTLFSYRFPLDFVYRVLDSVFAEGIEAIFRFALALMAKSEDTLLALNFEDAVDFLKIKLVDVYLKREELIRDAPDPSRDVASATPRTRKVYATNDFVRDAFAMRVTPFMLDGYAAEFDAQVKAANAHRREVDALRLVNRNLAARVQALEDQLNNLNTEHVELVRQVVEARIAKEEIAEEFIRYKHRHPER